MAFRTSAVTNGTGITATVNNLAGVVPGDMMVMYIVTTTAVITLTEWPAAGMNTWRLNTTFTETAPSVRRVTVWTRVVGANEPTSFDPTFSASDTYCIILGAWSGRKVKHPDNYFTTTNSTANTTVVTMSMTGTTPKAGADVAVFKHLAKSVPTDVWTLGAVSGYTQRNNTNSGIHTVGLDTKDAAVAGATGTLTSTATRSTGTGTAGYGAFVFTLEAPDPTPSSVYLNNTQWGNDYVTAPSVPSNNILMSCWHKVTGKVGDFPRDYITNGDHNYFNLRSSSSQFQFLGGNLRNSTDPNLWGINENSSLWMDPAAGSNYMYAGDFTYLQTDEVNAESVALGWTWSCWQLINGASTVTIRQWTLIPPYNNLAYFEDIKTFADIRTAGFNMNGVDMSAWVPGVMDNLTLGDAGQSVSMAYARVHANVTTKPSDGYLIGLAKNFNADTTAYADWSLLWNTGAPVLADRSGNNRHLYTYGTVLQGVGEFPSFSTGPTLISAVSGSRFSSGMRHSFGIRR